MVCVFQICAQSYYFFLKLPNLCGKKVKKNQQEDIQTKNRTAKRENWHSFCRIEKKKKV